MPTDLALTDTATACQSCGTERPGEFCPQCGEQRFDRHDLSLPHVVEHGIEGFTHFDYKVPRTLWTLLTRPGVVEADILQGRRTIWAKPFALFVIVNLLFYFGASLIHFKGFSTPARVHATLSPYRDFAADLFASQAAQKGLSVAEYMESFDALAQSIAKTMPFLFAVLLPFVLAILLWKKDRFLLEHFYVSLLWTTRMLIVLLAIHLVFAVLEEPVLSLVPLTYDALTSLLLLFVLGWAWYGTFRRTYGVGPVASVATALAASLAFLVILIFVYRPVLMMLTVWLL